MRQELRLSRITGFFILLGIVSAGCERAEPELALDPGDYRASIEQWKTERVERLKSPTGYLNLAGLFWLRQGQNSFGAAAGNDIVFPSNAAPTIGTMTLENDRVELAVADGVQVRHGDELVEEIQLADDHSEDPVTLTHGSLAWTIIRRSDKFAVRLRDFENPAITGFEGIDYYPIDESMRVVAALTPYKEPRQITVDTVIEGLDYEPMSPGTLQFVIDGVELELEAYDAGDEFFLIFADNTSGRETYGAGRFLYADKPGKNGTTVLDFNRAYNPPCAFNEFATCPVASSRNRLRVAILAGEKFSPAFHKTGTEP